MIDTAQLDAVVIATPTATHFDAAKYALEHDLHVFVEKPLCLKAEQSKTLSELAIRKKRTNQVGYHNRFIGTFIARPKFMKGNSALARYVVNGWELNGIVTLASQRPNFESISYSSTTNVTTLIPFTTLNGLGGDNRVPFLPNNPLHIDPITRADARISKTFPIGERMTLGLLFEAFNVSNTISNTGVISSGFTAANKGTITAPQFVIAPCGNATATTWRRRLPDSGASQVPGWDKCPPRSGRRALHLLGSGNFRNIGERPDGAFPLLISRPSADRIKALAERS
jgi:hypothetical protein